MKEETMYKPKYFTIEELVHPQIIADIGEENAWMRLDEGCLCDLDTIRELWGSAILINYGGADSRGLRPPNDPDGAFYSVHKQGKAFDLVHTSGRYLDFYSEIHYMIKGGELKSFNTMEDWRHTPSWVHVAKMNHDQKPLIIKP